MYSNIKKITEKQDDANKKILIILLRSTNKITNGHNHNYSQTIKLN